MLKGMTTRSPFFRLVTALPTSSTMPMGSWPSTSSLCIYGPSTSYRWRSEPQIADDVILTIASVGSLMTGSGTSFTVTERLPCQVSAFNGMPSCRCTSRPFDRNVPGSGCEDQYAYQSYRALKAEGKHPCFSL